MQHRWLVVALSFVLFACAHSASGPRCPKGSRFDGESCVATNVVCPSGSKWNGDACVAGEADGDPEGLQTPTAEPPPPPPKRGPSRNALMGTWRAAKGTDDNPSDDKPSDVLFKPDGTIVFTSYFFKPEGDQVGGTWSLEGSRLEFVVNEFSTWTCRFDGVRCVGAAKNKDGLTWQFRLIRGSE